MCNEAGIGNFSVSLHTCIISRSFRKLQTVLSGPFSSNTTVVGEIDPRPAGALMPSHIKTESRKGIRRKETGGMKMQIFGP